MDIFPTVCSIVNAPFEHSIDGVSFESLLTGKTKTLESRDLFFHRREGGTRYGGLIANAMIRGDWKLLQNGPFEPQQLFNLANDPQEKNDLKAKNKAKFQELAIALRAHVQRSGEVPWQKPGQ